MAPLLSYYGDDFTGSTDTMEALASHGVETVLFTRLPSDDEFRPFTGFEAFGLAGTSRSQPPTWMDEHLPQTFAWLKRLGARFCHYKVCSTFDSSPETGSIGRATDIGARLFAQARVPLIVGAPQLKRYTFAGHLFAAYQGEIYRIDRHPVMSRHPVTPMHEADLRLHLGRQTTLQVALEGALKGENGVELFDVFDAETQIAAGRKLLATHAAETFVVGSSGVEYALVKALAADGRIAGKADFAPLAKADRVIAVSGSVSPTTERQIRHALDNGFEGLRADPLELAGEARAASIGRLANRAVEVLGRGRSVVIYTALGPASNIGEKLDAIPGGRHRVGEALGVILRNALQRTELKRVVVSGGDSSGHALSQLDIHALTTRLPLKGSPGSPLCTAHSSSPAFSGIEIAMKGGQLGGDGYFVQLRDGTA